MITMTPHKQSPTLHLSCSVNKRLIKKGKHNRSLKVALQGPDLLAHPHKYIHTYMRVLFCSGPRSVACVSFIIRTFVFTYSIQKWMYKS
jgi:hypothetical protein